MGKPHKEKHTVRHSRSVCFFMGISKYSACGRSREDFSSDETRFRARSIYAIATRRNFVKYDGKDSAEISCDKFLEVPYHLHEADEKCYERRLVSIHTVKESVK